MKRNASDRILTASLWCAAIYLVVGIGIVAGAAVSGLNVNRAIDVAVRWPLIAGYVTINIVGIYAAKFVAAIAAI
jgi:hypothetical protein